MKPLTIDNKRSKCIFDIEKVQSQYNAKYVGEFCLPTKDGSWSESPVSVFYVEKPEKPEYSNYFGLFTREGKTFITDALAAAEAPFFGIVANDGEVIYSAYRHDFTRSKDGSVFIDGGRDYVRRSLGSLVKLKIVKDKIEVIELLP